LRPDVLITSNWGSIEVAMANLVVGLPHLHMEDGFGPEERDRQLPRRVWARRLLLRRSVVMLPSQTLRRIAGDIWKLPAKNLRTIPNGVDLELFAPSPPGSRWRGEHPVIGTVAALRPEKNIARLIHAFAQIDRDRGARLVIVGDGGERPALESLARELSLDDRIEFVGHIEAPQARYASFDLFALSSDTEQMPLSVLEAMAAGLPVVATDVGDVRSMVADENAAHIAPCDDTALAAALNALLVDPANARRIGAANRIRAERMFALDTMIAAHGALIEAVRTRAV
jgi:glycosyltransferase involved in cell wall biosynthesis